MVSATESFCSRNQPFGFFPSKVRQRVAPRWTFQLDLALAGSTIFSRCGGIAVQWTGAGGRTKLLVALSLLVFVTRNGWLWVTATTGAGASYGPLSAPWRRTIPCSLPCSLRLQMGALEPASSWGSSAPLAGGAVQLG